MKHALSFAVVLYALLCVAGTHCNKPAHAGDNTEARQVRALERIATALERGCKR